MAAEKRRAGDDFGNSQMVVKKQNVGSSNALVTKGTSSSGALVSISRTSKLEAPVMELSGHSGEIFTAKFDPTGNMIASGSMDRTIMLWNTYTNPHTPANHGLLTGHKGAILDVQWSRDSSTLYSASADCTLASWNLETGQRIRRFTGHEEVVNTLSRSPRGQEILLSGSDDSTISLWDPRQKEAIHYITTPYPVTTVELSPNGEDFFYGGIDNDVHAYSMRAKAVTGSLVGHRDTVTSLRVSPDSRSLLSFSMDGTARTWNIENFASGDRQRRTYDGATASVEKNLVSSSWDPEGKKIAAGSGDGTVVVWGVETGKILYKLPGHKGVVNCAEFGPGPEPLILSGSSDRNLILGELR